jgi:hypothetical protein
MNSTGATIAASGIAAVGLGALAVVQPMAGIAAVGIVAAGLLVALGRHLAPFFLGFLGVVLAGYAFFGRGFAYLGVSPLYIGELLLGIALLTLVVNVRRWRLSLMSSLLLLFMTLGILATIPYLAVHGIDALRDAVIWGYGIFAFAVAWSVRKEHFAVITRWYGKLLPVFILCAPVFLIASNTLASLPMLPGSNASFFDPKPGDLAVHLAGGAAFLIVGLWTRRSELRSFAELLLWPAWFAGIGLAGSLNRGGLTSAAIGVALTFVLRPSGRFVRPLFVAALLITVTIFVDPTIDIGANRQISLNQITDNLKSVVGSSGDSNLGGTREWRLRWWEDIVDYTVHGQYFWTGKGFGINLANADGYQVEADDSLRSPHNSHMTVLARMGVPGMLIWAVLHVTFGLIMLINIRRAHRRRDAFWVQITVWLFVYWLVMIINSSFDVYLEGPQGGIWFWTIVGLGLAACRIQQREALASTGQDQEHPAQAQPYPSSIHAKSGRH